MKHGFQYSPIDSHSNILHAMNRIQSVASYNSQIVKLWPLNLGIRIELFLSTTLKRENPSTATIGRCEGQSL